MSLFVQGTRWVPATIVEVDKKDSSKVKVKVKFVGAGESDGDQTWVVVRPDSVRLPPPAEEGTKRCVVIWMIAMLLVLVLVLVPI